MIVRFSQSGPEKLSPESKPLDVGDWPAAWDAVEAALAKVGADLAPALDKARALDDADRRARSASSQQPRPRRPGASYRRASTPPRPRTLRCRFPIASSASAGFAALRRGAEDRRRRRTSLTLTRRAAISQSTGEDWSDVALTVSTARVARAVDVVDCRTRGSTSGSRRASMSAARLREGAARRRPASRCPPRRRRPRRSTSAAAPRPLAPIAAAGSRGAIAGRRLFRGVQGGRARHAGERRRAEIVRARPRRRRSRRSRSRRRRASIRPPMSRRISSMRKTRRFLPGRVALLRDGAFVGEAGRLRRARRWRRSRLRRRRQGQGRPRAGQPQGERSDLVQSDQDRDARIRHQRQEPARLPDQGAGDRPNAGFGEHARSSSILRPRRRRRRKNRSATSAG